MTPRQRDPKIQSFVGKLLAAAKQTRWQGLYTPYGHLAATIGISGTTAIYAVMRTGGWRGTSDLVFVASVYTVANFFEWFAHKYALHRKLPGFAILYHEHRGKHHRIYRRDDMVARHNPGHHPYAEWQFILIPARGIFGVNLAAGLIAAAAAATLGWHHAFLAMATSSLYVLTYELLHLAFHSAWLEEPRTRYTWYEHPLERLRYDLSWVLRKLRENHARHHDPRVMDEEYMNVTVPFADTVITFVKWVTRQVGRLFGRSARATNDANTPSDDDTDWS